MYTCTWTVTSRPPIKFIQSHMLPKKERKKDLCQVRTGLGVLQRLLDSRLELVTVDFIDELDLLQALRAGLESFLVANDVAVVRAAVSCVDVQVDCDSKNSKSFVFKKRKGKEKKKKNVQVVEFTMLPGSNTENMAVSSQKGNYEKAMVSQPGL